MSKEAMIEMHMYALNIAQLLMIIFIRCLVVVVKRYMPASTPTIRQSQPHEMMFT